MADVLEELTADPLSRQRVEDRLQDWDDRIESLYAQVMGWLGPGWTANRIMMSMLEKPMREAEVAERLLPGLQLLERGVLRASVEPRGLWIIGANGRLDLTTDEARYLIVDKAQIFEPPQWVITDALDRTHQVVLDKARLRSILRADDQA